MEKKEIMKALRRMRRKAKRRLRRLPKVAWRIGKRIARKQARKTKRRIKKSAGFARRLARSGPKRLMRRWIKRKARKVSGRKTVGVVRGGRLTKTAAKKIGYATPPARRGWRHDIVPGRTMIEWLPVPQLGRGRVLAYIPGNRLDVEFEQGGRPPNGVPLEEIRVLA